jgi:hypothetical protein
MKPEQTYLIRFNGQKPIRFKIPPSETPTTLTISPHENEAIVTITPTANSKTPPQPKASRNIFSRKNIQGILRALRAELNRRDGETTRTP